MRVEPPRGLFAQNSGERAGSRPAVAGSSKD
jgi:hypothetical protein